MYNSLLYHSHPQIEGKTVFGRCVMVGDRLQKGDLYPGVKGWTEIPQSIVGQVLEDNHPTIIVRPDRLAVPSTV